MPGSQSTQLVVLDDNDKKSMVRTYTQILDNLFHIGLEQMFFFL